MAGTPTHSGVSGAYDKVPQIIVTAYVHKSQGKHLLSRNPPQRSTKGTHNRYCLSLGNHTGTPLLVPHPPQVLLGMCPLTTPANSLPLLKALSLAPHKWVSCMPRLSYHGIPYLFSLIVAKASKNQSRYNRDARDMVYK